MTSARTWLAVASAVTVAGATTLWFVRRAPEPPPVAVRPPPPPPAPSSLEDPLAPDRPMRLDEADRFASDDWVRARPGFQYSKPAAERGGAYPCAPQKADVSAFEDWQPLGKGRFVVPKRGALDENGRFTLVVHLNGDELARRELSVSEQPFVLYGLTIDPSKSYGALFSGSGFLKTIIESVRDHLSKTTGRPAELGHLALSAWSAGFAGIRAILHQPEAKDVEAVVLIDGLHTPRNPERMAGELGQFVSFAKRAVAGERFFMVAHSSIDPPTYASTTETAHFLVSSLGQKPRAVRRNDAVGLELVESFSAGNFHVRGYAGNDKSDHCAQVFLLRDAYRALGRYFAK